MKAHYIILPDMRFAVLEPDGAVGFTTCPHEATLFTSGVRAATHVTFLRRHWPGARAVPCEVNNRLIIKGDGL